MMGTLHTPSSMLTCDISDRRYRYILMFLVLCCGIWGMLPLHSSATIDIETDDAAQRLEDGSRLEIAEDTILLYEPLTDTQEQRIRWSVPADNPRQTLLFETPLHGQCLLYVSPQPDRRAEFHALRLVDGQDVWVTPVIIGASIDTPATPVFAPPWIYFGQGTWLEQMNPEDGTIVNRYPLREIIQNLDVSSDGSIEAVVETFEASQLSIRFQDGVWFPHIAASSSLSSSSLLLNRAAYVMPDFAGTLEPSEYRGYLDLLRIKKKPVSPEDIVIRRNFDLKKAEAAYQQASQTDLANPYLTLYLAFALYYQGQQQVAAASIDEALRRSAGFWAESLRLGAMCDSLGQTAWADAFYEQGMAQYFQEIPAPSEEISLDEVLAIFFQEQSSVLFASGRVDRALHLLELRRQLFPYTEGDNLFSRKYVDWLQQSGQARKARQEQQRIGIRKLVFDRVAITPFSFWNFVGLTIVFLYLIILKNDIRHWSEFIVFVLIIAFIDSVATLDLFGTLSLPKRILVHTTGLSGYILVVTWLRRRRTPSKQSFWGMLIVVAMSSYILLIRGTLPAYYAGFYLTKSQVGAKGIELLFILGFMGTYLLLRRRLSKPPVLRYGKLLVAGLIMYTCWGAWLHHWGSVGIITMNFPRPWADKGHPNWVIYIDQQAEKAEFRKQDVRFLRALVYQSLGRTSIAEQLYQPLHRDGRALNNLGVLVSKQHREAAQTYFQQALQRDPDCLPARYNLAVLTKNQADLEQIARDAWLPGMYQRYAPERLWIITPPLEEWCRILYWSRGGFLYKSFLESMVRVTNPAKLFQADLQQLR